ncbi:hypothetical protein BW41_03826 [Sphingomonas sp. RIT328]|nr:hypothetical protein BW41_03826 [Sphingomonas sp. RIT328]
MSPSPDPMGAPSDATADALSVAFLGEARTYGATLRSRF